jgi:hypothetical protein
MNSEMPPRITIAPIAMATALVPLKLLSPEDVVGTDVSTVGVLVVGTGAWLCGNGDSGLGV